MTRIGLIIEINSLHHILLKTSLTTNPTGIQQITAVIQGILVLVLETGHLRKTGTGSPRIDRVGIVGAGPEMEIKVADRTGQLTDSHGVAGQGVNQDITEGHVLPPTRGVINMRKPQPGQPHRTVSHSEGAEGQPLAQETITVPDLGHWVITGSVVHHVIGRTNHSPVAGTAPEIAKDKLSNAETAVIEHGPIPKDVLATLSSVEDLLIGKEPPPTQADPQAGMHQGFARTVVDQTA